MLIGCVADTHFGKQVDAAPGFDRDLETLRQVDAALHVFRERRVDLVAVLGDVSNSNHPSIATNKRILEFLRILESADLPAIIIPGNHDYTYAGNHALEPFVSGEDVTFAPDAEIRIVDSPEDLDGFSIVPWQPAADMAELIRQASEPVILTHCLLNGAKLGHYLFEHATEPPAGKYIVAGDVHRPQSYAWDRSVVSYPGSLTQHDFGERSDEKGVLILDTQQLEVEFVPLDGHARYFHAEVGNLEELAAVWPQYEAIADVLVTDGSLVEDARAWLAEQANCRSVRRVAVRQQIDERPDVLESSVSYEQQFAEYVERAELGESVLAAGKKIMAQAKEV